MPLLLLKNGSSELYADLVAYIMKIMDYMLRSQKKARKEMSKMGGKILESYTERTEKNAQKKIVEAVKDIRKGLNSAELKKKYSADTIRLAKSIV